MNNYKLTDDELKPTSGKIMASYNSYKRAKNQDKEKKYKTKSYYEDGIFNY